MKSFVQLAVLLASLQLQGVLAVPARMDSVDIREIDTGNGASIFATIHGRDSGSQNGDETEYLLVESVGGTRGASGAQNAGSRGHFASKVAQGGVFAAPTSSDSVVSAKGDEKEYANGVMVGGNRHISFDRPKSAEGARLAPPSARGRRNPPPSPLKEAVTHAADVGAHSDPRRNKRVGNHNHAKRGEEVAQVGDIGYVYEASGGHGPWYYVDTSGY